MSSAEVAAVGLVTLAGGSAVLALGALTGSLVLSALAGPRWRCWPAPAATSARLLGVFGGEAGGGEFVHDCVGVVVDKFDRDLGVIEAGS